MTTEPRRRNGKHISRPQKRLDRRISRYESLPPHLKPAYRKPGSLKKPMSIK